MKEIISVHFTDDDNIKDGIGVKIPREMIIYEPDKAKELLLIAYREMLLRKEWIEKKDP